MKQDFFTYQTKRIKVFLFIIFSTCFISGTAQNKKALVEQINKRGEAYILIQLPNKKTLYRLNKVVSIDKVSTTKNYVYAYISKHQLDKFESLGLKYDVQAPLKLSVNMCPDLSSVKNWNCYPTYTQYIDLMNEFATNYPNLCKLEEIGTSVAGRSVLSLKISDNVQQSEEEPAFFYTSTMHGNEVVGYVLMLRLADYLLSNYQSDNRIKQLIDSTEIWINPLANPDGTYAAGNADLSGATRSNYNSYDLNRNFPDPEDGEYPNGTRQKETQDMMNFMANHHFVFAANLHEGAEVVNYPWDTWYTRHADDDWYIKISRQYADTVHANSTNYMTDLQNGITNGADWYSISGGRQDYANYYLHSRETTIELSSTKIPDAASLPDFWNYNYRSFLNYIDRVHYGFYGKITDSTGSPIKAKLSIENHDTDSSEIYSNPENGMYYRMIAAGSYNLIFSAPEFDSVLIPNVTIAEDEKIRLDVVMKKKNTTSILYNTQEYIHIKQINNPFNDRLSLNLYLLKNTDEINISLIDISGKIQNELFIKNLYAGDNQISVNTSKLSKGVYILKIGSKQFILQQKIVKN